jgi:hypothetical protein
LTRTGKNPLIHTPFYNSASLMGRQRGLQLSAPTTLSSSLLITHQMMKSRIRMFTQTANHSADEKAPSESRLGSVDTLKKNPPLNESIEDYQKSCKLSKDNSFKAVLTSRGQVKWVSSQEVYAWEIEEVVRGSIANGRSLHINTGTHGDKAGNTVAQNPKYAESQFTKEDIKTVWNDSDVSVHIMSSHSPALTEEQHPSIDIIDAWCYSEVSQHRMRTGDDPLGRWLQKLIIEKVCKPIPTSENRPHTVVNSVTGNMSDQATNNNSGTQMQVSEEGTVNIYNNRASEKGTVNIHNNYHNYYHPPSSQPEPVRRP